MFTLASPGLADSPKETTMAFLRTLLLASALAMPISATFLAMTDHTAASAGKSKKAKAKKKAAMKSCGTFMYRKDGKCLDARLKK
jgi:hypothetical protein